MRKIIAALLALALGLGLCACGKSPATQAVEALIAGIGQVTRDSGGDILAAEEALAALTEKERKRLDGAEVLSAARGAYDALLAGDVDALILKIGPVDETSGPAILAAREAYDALTDGQRTLVANSGLLADSAGAFDALRAGRAERLIAGIEPMDDDAWDRIETAKKALELLTEEQRKLVSNLDELDRLERAFYEAHVAPVEKLIEEAAAFDLTGDELPDGAVEAVNEAGEAFNSLAYGPRQMVGNREKLETAQTALADLRVRLMTAYIDQNIAGRPLDGESGERIMTARAMYEELSQAEKDRIDNYNAVETAAAQAEAALAEPPVRILGYTMGSTLVGGPLLNLRARNVSDKTLEEFTFRLYAYNSEGAPVMVDFDDYCLELGYYEPLEPGAGLIPKEGAFMIFAEKRELSSYVAVLESALFEDGTGWVNPNMSLLHAKYNEQLLTEPDENTLHR